MLVSFLRRSRKSGCLLKHQAPALTKKSHIRPMAQFFAPNGEKSDVFEVNKNARDHIPDSILHSLTSKNQFLDPNTFYPEVEITDSSILEAVLQYTYEPVNLWLDICNINLKSTPQVGSFVEFIYNHEIQFGVVLREPYARFNPYHNRMIVLTLLNDLVKVYPQDITFSMHRVLDTPALSLTQILTNRFNESYAPRAKLVQILHQFMAVVATIRSHVAHSLKISHSNLTSDEKLAPVCLLELARFILSLELTPLPSYFHQSGLLMAIYLEMCSDPCRWMVPGCIPSLRTTNLSSGAFSNTLPPPPVIFATSVPVLDDLLRFFYSDETLMNEFNNVLEIALHNPMKYDDLVLQFCIWDAKRHKLSLKSMMYAIIYPHPKILSKISLLRAFRNKIPSRESIMRLLKDVGLYDNSQNALTDPFISAGIFGNVKRLSLIASSSKDLETDNLTHSATVEAHKEKFVDNFPHLRKSRLFFHDTTAYILPGISRNLAISMEEINSRRFLINIHVADLASRLSPSSATFEKWSGSNAFLENKPNLLGVEKSNLLPPEATKDVLFNKTRPRTKKDYFAVGDYLDEERLQSSSDKQNCMTITFEYNSYLEDPMKNLFDSARITFDALQDFQFKSLDAGVLEKSLTGKLEPSIFGKLKLFKHKEPKQTQTDEPLDSTDHYNINFIYNVLRRHFEARNRSYAVSLDQKSRQRDIEKTLSAEKDTEVIKTHILLTRDEEQFEKTMFLRSEAEILAGRITSEYAEKNHIPVFYESKELLDQEDPESRIKDEVLIHHDNILLPDFSAASYFQVPYGRDGTGHISTAAFLFASNFLGLDTVSTTSGGENAPLGMRKGFVNVVDVTQSMKAYINQLQILEHVHFTQTANSKLFKKAHLFSHLRSLGYSLHGSKSKATIDAHSDKFMACSMGTRFLAATQRKYWVLKAIERNPAKFCEMKCIVTHISRDIDMGLQTDDEESISDLQVVDDSVWPEEECQIVRAYCEELGIEVYLLVGRQRAVQVGSEKIATDILHVDATLGVILMG